MALLSINKQSFFIGCNGALAALQIIFLLDDFQAIVTYLSLYVAALHMVHLEGQHLLIYDQGLFILCNGCV